MTAAMTTFQKLHSDTALRHDRSPQMLLRAGRRVLVPRRCTPGAAEIIRAGPLYVPRRVPSGGFPREDRQLHPTPSPPANLTVAGRSKKDDRELSTAEVQRVLDEDGVVAVRGAVVGPWLELAQEAVQGVMAAESSQGVVVGGTKGPPDVATTQHEPRFRQFTLQGAKGLSLGLTHFVRLSPTADLAASMLQPPSRQRGGQLRVAFEADDIFVKEAHAEERTPWHRDVAAVPFSFPGEGSRLLNVWMALDNIPEVSSLRVLRGSHRWQPDSLGGPGQEEWAAGLLGPDWRKEVAQLLDLPPTLSSEDADDLVTTFAVERLEQLDVLGFHRLMVPLAFSLAPGDCALFHRQAIHGANGNTTDSPRTALSTRWSTKTTQDGKALTPRYHQSLA